MKYFVRLMAWPKLKPSLFWYAVMVYLVLTSIQNVFALEKNKPQPGENWTDPITQIQFLWVPKGCYEMGSESSIPDEVPAHEVCLDAFWMGKTEVTQRQWQKTMGSNPAYLKKCGLDCPIENITWKDAQIFSEKIGAKFRLPTEAEWESTQ